MNIFVAIGVIVASAGVVVFASVVLRRVKLKKVSKIRRLEEKEEKQDQRLRVWSYIIGLITIFSFAFAIFAWFFPPSTKLAKGDAQHIIRTEEDVKEVKEDVKLIKRQLGSPADVDGLPKAEPQVFDPFKRGSKLMDEFRWGEAITEFRRALRNAKASQLVSLYNLIGHCYFTPGELDSAQGNYNRALLLASDIADKKGQSEALNNIGIVLETKDSLDRALTYLTQALEIARDTGYKEGEEQSLRNLSMIYAMKGNLGQARDSQVQSLYIARAIHDVRGEAASLGNLGSIYYLQGKLDTALAYHTEALNIDKNNNNKLGAGQTLNNIGIIFDIKGEKDKALEYYLDALTILTKVGAQIEIDMVKENIRTLKGK
jgi:tetratricopeptide (TPR) repeat protein